MDSVFLLTADARSRFLHSVAGAIGCSYICLWSYLPQPSNCLFSLDGWFHKDQTSLSRGLFDAYRASFCSVESGCVPGLVYKSELAYIDLVDSELMNISSSRLQRKFYQEAGIKRAVFMGCKNGEVELGMSGLTNINLKMIQELFNEDFVRQFQFPDQSHPSSSSLRSGGSPESSSLFLNKPTASLLPETTTETTMEATQHLIQPISAIVCRQHNIQFPTPASVDAAIMEALLTVISSTAASSSSPFLYHSPHQEQASRLLSAFMPYHASPGSGTEFTSGSMGGQRMIKMSISMLRRINLMRAEAQMRESQPSSANQLHRMLSERKRREKINDNLRELRMLLRPGTKKDQATVLSKTREFINGLKAHITELEERNKMLEMQLAATDETNQVDDSTERVQVQILQSAESTSEMQQISLRATVRQQCDTIDLLTCILQCLKEIGVVISVISVNTIALQTNVSTVVIRFHVKAIDWNEESFREAITSAVESFVAALPAATTNQ